MTPGASVIPFRSPQEIEGSLSLTVGHLRAHRLLAYPTETVYGLGGSADHVAVEALVALKQRPTGKPFLLLIAGREMLDDLGVHLTPSAAVLAARFWPGPLTLVLPTGGRRVPDPLLGPDGGLAVRWTSHPGLLQLLRAYGAPITSTSANRSGASPAMSVAPVVSDWRDEIASGLLRVLDGGTLFPSLPSTVVDCMRDSPRIIRPGAVSTAALRVAVPDLIGDT